MTGVVDGGQSGTPSPVAESTRTDLVRGSGPLATAALQSMDERLAWFRAMDPQDRSWVGLVAQAAIAAFLDWYAAGGPSVGEAGPEVSPDVFAQLTGRTVDAPTTVDLRAVLAAQASAAGVRAVATSTFCTRCDNDRFYSHRAGDAGRQIAVLMAPV